MEKFNSQLILILESFKVFVLLYLIGYILNGFENFFNPVSWVLFLILRLKNQIKNKINYFRKKL